jgi:transcriptional regulator with XRE-family HTH domain
MEYCQITNTLFQVLSFIIMGFRENLRDELAYSGMLVKELAARTGISKRTLDNYLNNRGHMPDADIAVKMARVLGVSVEYLVTGKEEGPHKTSPRSPESRILLDVFNKLKPQDRKIVLLLAKALQDRPEPLA